MYYDDTNGTLIAHAHAGSITALEIRSQSEQLATDGPINGRGLFDVEKASHVFRLEPSGPTTIYLDSALPTGLSLAELQEDLLVDGAMLIGGGLGNVRLSSIENLPVDVAYGNGERATPTGNGGRSFVDVNHANVILAYNPSTGDITITSQSGTRISARQKRRCTVTRMVPM